VQQPEGSEIFQIMPPREMAVSFFSGREEKEKEKKGGWASSTEKEKGGKRGRVSKSPVATPRAKKKSVLPICHFKEGRDRKATRGGGKGRRKKRYITRCGEAISGHGKLKKRGGNGEWETGWKDGHEEGKGGGSILNY